MNKPFLRNYRLRFSLRNMLVVLVLISLSFGLLWQKWWIPWQRQMRAVRLIDSRVNVGGIEFGNRRYEPIDDLPMWKKTLANWLGRDSVARVTLAFSEGTGEFIDISCWKDLPSVERVVFDRALVKDLSPIAGFRKLKEFKIYQTGSNLEPGNAGLEVLGTCPNLETIHLTSCRFPMNDETLDSVCNARSIRKLRFDPRDCTNLKPLLQLHQLEDLEIRLYTAPYRTDLDLIEKLSGLKNLSITISYRSDIELDFGFLSGLSQLETCRIAAKVTDEQQLLIRNQLPANCTLTFD